MTLLAVFVSQQMPKWTKRLILWKEKAKNREYERYYRGSKLYWYFNTAIIFAYYLYLLMMVESTPFMLFYALVGACVLLVRHVDQHIRIIPNELVLVILFLGLLKQSYLYEFKGLMESLFSMIIVLGIFYLSAQLSKHQFGEVGVGAGDVKLTAAMAVFFPRQELMIFLMSIVAIMIIYFVYGMLILKIKMKTSFPMGVQLSYAFLLSISLIIYVL